MDIQLASLLHKTFATDQEFIIEQQDDGTYRKRTKKVTPAFLRTVITEEKSIAIYQKNIDQSIKWICFDFDVLKCNIGSEKSEESFKELNNSVLHFSEFLNELGIPYLLEYSGNRGFHIWITFGNSISFNVGHQLQQELLKKSNLEFNNELIGIDLYPSSSIPTGGLGLGVKLPLSKHKKSGLYSYILKSNEELYETKKITTLDDDIKGAHIEILESHKPASKYNIEKALNIYIDDSIKKHEEHLRVKSIHLNSDIITFDDIIKLWASNSVLSVLSKKLTSTPVKLNNKERKLIVGILCNLKNKSKKEIGVKLIHEIFRKTDNYNYDISDQAIRSLKDFNFPAQTTIESVLLKSFDVKLDTIDLLKTCIPKFELYLDGTFDFTIKDVEITKSAELSYLFMNDEVQVKNVINNFFSKDNTETLTYLKNFISNSAEYEYHTHLRYEEKKERKLVTLGYDLRVATSCILKQISYHLDIKKNNNSHGYIIKKGFSDGHIFEPWLYLWLKFISNISEAIESNLGSNEYIVKTDISSFYDSIPHDKIKRKLLGDGNNKISSKINSLNNNAKQNYLKCIDSLFKLTEIIVEKKEGLPQGPAYARYFAELYLIDIDEKFETKIANGEVLIYQRYVDDIFFVARDKSSATKIFEELKSDLENLSLIVNEEKTVISSLSGFITEFNEYKSQSKYSIDQIDKRFSQTTDKQKELAIEEILGLIQSDSCQEDLSFIFSHVNDFEPLNKVKSSKIAPTINNKIGRGSLFKNLFNFAIENEDCRKLLLETENYTELQSEVFTSCIITNLENERDDDKIKDILNLLAKLESKLKKTRIVNEHLSYISIYFNNKNDFKDILPNIHLSVIKAACSSNTYLSNDFLDYVNTEINDIKSFTEFIKIIYTLSFSEKTKKDELSVLSKIFAAKISSESESDGFSIVGRTPDNSLDPSATQKLYFLLCLYSLSINNSSIKTLEKVWTYCIFLVNENIGKKANYNFANWIEKLRHIEIEGNITNVILTSIIDGNFVRGVEDKHGVFKDFHSIVLIYLTLEVKIDLNRSALSAQLNQLKEKSIFYGWLLDSEDVSFFPESKEWFQANIIGNGFISLKKNNEVLIRKRTSDFLNNTNLMPSGNEHSEKLVSYNIGQFVSLKNQIKNLSLKDSLNILVNLIDSFDGNRSKPSIFCNDNTINKNNSALFSNEFVYKEKIIYENEFDKVHSYENSIENFINCFLDTISSVNDEYELIIKKYFSDLTKSINAIDIIKNASLILGSFGSVVSKYEYDLVFAASLYQSLQEHDSLNRLDLFIEQYSKFNRNIAEKHVYGVNPNIDMSTTSLDTLLTNIIESVKAPVAHCINSVPLYIYKDIEQYKSVLEKLVASSELSVSINLLSSFKLSKVTTSPISMKIECDDKKYDFNKVKVINYKTQEITNFEIRHISLLKITEHVFTCEHNSTLYIIALNKWLSTIVIDIKERIEQFSGECSYPLKQIDESIQQAPGFDNAVTVISQHQNISEQDAALTLKTWIEILPKRFQKPLIKLISAHEYMNTKELDNFLVSVSKLVQSNKNTIFFIKKFSDFNGTHRILSRDNELCRRISSLEPLNLCRKSSEVNFIVDLAISGSQICSAIEIYTGKEKKPNNDKSFYAYDDMQKKELLEVLKGKRKINIHCVLYTKNAKIKLHNKLKELLSDDVEVVFHGRDITDSAFFGSTLKLSAKDKTKIRELLTSSTYVKELYCYLEHNGSPKAYTEEEMDNINLVTRYLSLTKKPFKFFQHGLVIDGTCSPFKRIKEPKS